MHAVTFESPCMWRKVSKSKMEESDAEGRGLNRKVEGKK
jgi:hypothetical protein